MLREDRYELLPEHLLLLAFAIFAFFFVLEVRPLALLLALSLQHLLGDEFFLLVKEPLKSHRDKVRVQINAVRVLLLLIVSLCAPVRTGVISVLFCIIRLNMQASSVVWIFLAGGVLRFLLGNFPGNFSLMFLLVTVKDFDKQVDILELVNAQTLAN